MNDYHASSQQKNQRAQRAGGTRGRLHHGTSYPHSVRPAIPGVPSHGDIFVTAWNDDWFAAGLAKIQVQGVVREISVVRPIGFVVDEVTRPLDTVGVGDSLPRLVPLPAVIFRTT